MLWLVTTIENQHIDVLLVAGDIFDTSTPSNRAQELYYRFLCRVAASPCRHVVIIGGNHDSPTFLNAPQELLKALNIHVIGSKSPSLDDEILVLHDRSGEPEIIVCAVPYLRDRDIRTAEAGESIADKEQKLQDGIREHYTAIAKQAMEKWQQLERNIPVVAMGHLFTAGGKTEKGDGVRELYVGSLAHIHASVFSEDFDYVALGHLHVPQQVSESQMVRYSGSPLPMGFGEARQQKSVCRVSFSGRKGELSLIPVPVFQKLENVKGNWEDISRRITELSATESTAWLEVTYEGDDIVADLREKLEDAVANSSMEVLRVKNHRIIDRVLEQSSSDETLDDLDVHDVFERCLDAHDIAPEQRPGLVQVYQEALKSLYEDDVSAQRENHQ